LFEHHLQIHAKIESKGKINVFQCCPKKYCMPLFEQHEDVSTRVEKEKKLNIYQRCSKKNLPLHD